MKVISIIILILIFESCSNKSNEQFVLPSDKDINEIVETIIQQDSLPVYKNNSSPDTIIDSDNQQIIFSPINRTFSVDLEKLLVFLKHDTSNYSSRVQHPIGKGLELKDLINFCNVDSLSYFTKNDSAYLEFQNDTLNSFVFQSTILQKINITNWEKEKNRRVEYFGCSIPIFSADRTKAYVELTNHCYGLCGSASGYLLFKKNGKWTIVCRKGLWIS